MTPFIIAAIYVFAPETEIPVFLAKVVVFESSGSKLKHQCLFESILVW